ncbi:MAG: VWA domain-containing protein [Deltaproteobacteria bacterium]|nr:VWA domain-containing protein [Deltaproteobacteria bacterium]
MFKNFSISKFAFASLLFFFSVLLFAQDNATNKIQVNSAPLELKNQNQEKIAVTTSPLEITITPQAGTVKVETTTTTTTPPPQPIPFQPTLIQSGMAVELILDASGSMNGLLGSDTKINAAKTIVEDLASQWASLKEPPVHLALRVFGSQYPLESNECSDSVLLVPLTFIDSAEIKKSLSDIEARGASCIAYALKKAAEDLSAQNEDRVIVLLADGRDTCNQDPCAVAKELHEGAFKIITHVVAYDVPQSDEAGLKCIAESSKGVFLLARTREELASALDEALRSTVPYNLRLKVLVGASPLPTTITIYKAGTQEVVQKASSYGIELFRLPPGNYDVMVEYSDSIEENRPSKILKGVELTGQGKVEQGVHFDLASITLSAHDAKGEPAETEYIFYKAGSEETVAKFKSDGTESTLFIQPGNYDLIANRTAPVGQEMTLSEPGIKISLEQGFVKNFSFQTGTLSLKGQTSQQQPVAMLYRVTRTGEPDAEISKGQVDSAGGSIELPPGTYDIFVEGIDPAVQVQPTGELKGIKIEGGAIVEQTITLKVGLLNLIALKGEKDPAPATFTVLDPEDGHEIAKITSQEGKASFALPPGKYNIQAAFLSTIYAKPPVAEMDDVSVDEGKTSEQKLVFQLGTVKLLARNVKEARIKATFYIYNWATEDVVATAGPIKDWLQLDLMPGEYDIKVIDAESSVDPKPNVWMRDIKVEAGTLYVREAVFTNAKLRMIGRGTNNEIIPVGFKIYEYNHDFPILSGMTGQDWQTFDISPGRYYIEASYHDRSTSQILKKWINLKVEENGLIEQELRY